VSIVAIATVAGVDLLLDQPFQEFDFAFTWTSPRSRVAAGF
jgi:hypothetical protein